MGSSAVGSGTALSLDRMCVEDAGANPERLAAAIHAQLPQSGSGAVPVADIAYALDIVEIREAPLTRIEGALLTTPERDRGSILLNSASWRQRRRFTLAHELGHFLNSWHSPTSPGGFQCSRGDMIEADWRSQDRHRRQEAEANRFAIELLAPRVRLKPYLRSEAQLRQVLEIADTLDISREAAARRYVELHDDCLAVVFSRNGRFIYYDRAQGFPGLCLDRGAVMPPLPIAGSADGLSDPEEASLDAWLAAPTVGVLIAQTVHQKEGHALTLLSLADADPDDPEDDELEDAYQRFEKFDRR